MKYLWVILKPLFVSVGIIISGYMAVDAWIIQRAETVVKPLESRIMAIRDTDIEHIDSRFNRIDDKLDKIHEAIREKR
jgi:hypothetical protein